jgi:hypothetical protein
MKSTKPIPIHREPLLPRSPYVIDLQRPLFSAENPHRPPQDPTDGLSVNKEDVAPQLKEEEHTKWNRQKNTAPQRKALLYQKEKEKDWLKELPVFSPPSAHLSRWFFPAHIPPSSFSPRSLGIEITAFLLIAFLFVAPFSFFQQLERAKTVVPKMQEVSHKIFEHLFLATEAMAAGRFAMAAEDFSQAKTSLGDLETVFAPMRGLLSAAKILPSTRPSVQTLTHLARAVEKGSLAAERLTASLHDMQTQSAAVDLTVKFNLLVSSLEEIQPYLAEAQEELTHVDATFIPQAYTALFENFSKELPRFSSAITEMLSAKDLIHELLGAHTQKRYLVLLQNNAEIRPTGGFIGSFAEVTVEKGSITKIFLPPGGSYDFQGSLSLFVEAPKPLQIVNPRFEFQDANWYPDFPTSAEQLLRFSQASDAPSFDGVIAVNATFMKEVVALLGPFEMPEYGVTIHGENFLFETQKIVELKYDPTAGPKQFLADLTPKLFQAAKNADGSVLLLLLDKMKTALQEHDIQIYLTNPSAQAAIADVGWSGQIAKTSGDYLMVVDTNLGGGKTDTVIDEDLSVEVQLEPDGSSLHTLSITRSHRGIQHAIFSGVNNVDYVRVYVPEGSELISATGDFTPPPDSAFETADIPLKKEERALQMALTANKDAASGTEVYEEFEKTVFGNWMQVKPGESATVQFIYHVPPRVQDLPKKTIFHSLQEFLRGGTLEHYTLFLQKQSGINTRRTRVRLTLPDTFQILSASNPGLLKEAGLSLPTSTDTFLSVLFEK